MKRPLQIALVITLATMTIACGEKFKGTIELEGMQQVSVKDENGSSRLLYPGPATVQIEEQGTLMDSTLKIESKDETFKFKIPKKAYTEALSFNVSSESTQQNFGLTGKYHEEIIGHHEEKRTESCRYAGVCCQADTGESYACKFRTRCKGKQKVLATVEKFNRFFEVGFIDDRSNQQIGQFTSEPKLDSRVIKQVDIGSCN